MFLLRFPRTNWYLCLLRASVFVLQGMRGVLVLLSGTGELQCCYLGTEPALFVAPPLEVHAIDYEQAGKELSELQKIIKAYTKKSGKTMWTVIKNVHKDSGLQKIISYLLVNMKVVKKWYGFKLLFWQTECCGVAQIIIPYCSLHHTITTGPIVHACEKLLGRMHIKILVFKKSYHIYW